MDPATTLTTRVRELVRERRIDPRADPAAVRQAAQDVVADHERASLTGAVRTLDETDAEVARLVADVAGLGVLQPYLDDPTIEEIWINAPDRVFVARGGRHELTSTILTADGVRELVERMLSSTGRRLDVSQPFVDANLPGGHRLHAVLDGISKGFTAVNIRKFVARAHDLEALVDLGTLDPAAARFLRGAVVAGLNIVVSGATQAGKTTLLNCLAGAIPGHERIVSAEEVYELQITHPDWVQLQCRAPGLEGTGGIDLRALVKESLRMRPTRLIIGEVRAAECLDLLLALNSGLPGLASIHASSARQALAKLSTLPLLAGENIGIGFVLPTVASTVDLVVHTAMDSRGQRAVREVVAVNGRIESGSAESEVVFERRGGELVRGMGRPVRTEAFERAGLDLDSLLGGRSWER
ncbi:CpaF family protein [Aeromicrobium sp. Leaf350]|uniref:CpaF family protein n=1 Tax=Aeromicrobium sp. Leaf350 TaxID=2876565 RepID=UPI001E42FE6F|nr:ATPase, T2SS/T4P/T4SS family [Aeromicrobium sp. Leaf350]